MALAFTTYTGIKASITQNDTIAFTYNGTAYTATVGALADTQDATILTAINSAIAAADNNGALGANKVTATFNGTNLVLTSDAVDKTLVGGNFTNVDIANTTDGTETAADTGAAAYSTYTGIKASITQNDTIAFTYNGTAYTATVGALADTQDATILTAINSAIAAADNNGALGANKVTATFNGTNLVLTSDAVDKTLVGGNFTDVDGVLPSDSAPGENTYDIINGFSLANDKIDLPTTAVLTDVTAAATGITDLTITVTNGLATFGGTAAATASFADKLAGLFSVLSADAKAAVIVHDFDGAGSEPASAYLVYGDGVAGNQSSDIFVCLVGVEPVSIATSAGGSALVIV